MTGALIAGLLPQRIMYTQWFAELSVFVAINTVLYLTLAVIKLLPKTYLSDWVNHRNRRAETRSIYPEGAVDLVPADRYGIQVLKPNDRAPQLRKATPTHVVEQLLSLAVLEPTLGAGRLADRLADHGLRIAASTAQKYLNQHDLGTRQQRIARAALVAAAGDGIVTQAT